jgi:decaprenylphospho-beta-D-erythro-pentofuranosid-2-ulose 2-reductase
VGSVRRVLIVGATSAIAEATARLFAAEGDQLCLAGRNITRLTAIAEDLRVRGAAKVETVELDANDFRQHEPVLSHVAQVMGGLDTVLIAHGTLPDQQACQTSVDAMIEAMTTNALSVIALLTLIANRFEQQGSGTIAVISSVAGDRGRQSNYVYGTAKSAVSTFAQGLRNRLARAGVKVVTIKPGFVDTPMTATFKKGALWATPGAVAKRIHRAMAKGEDVVYTPWFWRWIMAIIKAVPESIFKKARL